MMIGRYTVFVLALLGLGWSVDVTVKIFFTRSADREARFGMYRDGDLIWDFGFSGPVGGPVPLIQEKVMRDAEVGHKITVKRILNSGVVHGAPDGDNRQMVFFLKNVRTMKCWDGIIFELPGVPLSYPVKFSIPGFDFPYGLEDFARTLSFREFVIGVGNISGIHADYYVLDEGSFVFAFEKDLVTSSEGRFIPSHELRCVDEQTGCLSMMCCVSSAAGTERYGLVIQFFDMRNYDYGVVCIGFGPDGCSKGLYKMGLNRDVGDWTSMEVELLDEVVNLQNVKESVMMMGSNMIIKFYGVKVLGNAISGKIEFWHTVLGEVSLREGSRYNLGEAFGYSSALNALLYPKVINGRWEEDEYIGDEHPTTVNLRCVPSALAKEQSFLEIDVFYLDGLNGRTVKVTYASWIQEKAWRSIEELKSDGFFDIGLHFDRRIKRDARIFFRIDTKHRILEVAWNLPVSGLPIDRSSVGDSNPYFEIVERSDDY